MLAAYTVEVSSRFYRRPPTTTTTSSSTASSVSANMGPTNTTVPTFSKASERLEGVPVLDIQNDQEYARGYQFIRREVRSQRSRSIYDLSPCHNGRPSQNRTCA